MLTFLAGDTYSETKFYSPPCWSMTNKGENFFSYIYKVKGLAKPTPSPYYIPRHRHPEEHADRRSVIATKDLFYSRNILFLVMYRSCK